MCQRIAVIYNDTRPSRYESLGEQKAVLGVLDAVQAVDNALQELGHKVPRGLLILPLEETEKRLKSLKADLVFNLFKGFGGCPETEAEK